jgi:hypothetical protein
LSPDKPSDAGGVLLCRLCWAQPGRREVAGILACHPCARGAEVRLAKERRAATIKRRMAAAWPPKYYGKWKAGAPPPQED